jgi:hypothetical protein
MYPMICDTNIFSLIKKIENYRKKIITYLQNVKNDIRFINLNFVFQQNELLKSQDDMRVNYGVSSSAPDHIGISKITIDPYIKNQLRGLFRLKRKIIDELLLLQTAFFVIDQIFQQEIKNAEIIRGSWFFTKYKVVKIHKLNKFIEQILDPYKFYEPFVFSNEDGSGVSADVPLNDKRTSIFGTATGAATPRRQRLTSSTIDYSNSDIATNNSTPQNRRTFCW